MDYVIAILKLPFRALGFIVKHPRLIIPVGIVVFIIFGVITCSNTFSSKTAPVPQIAKAQPPAITAAPYVLRTSSRTYYVNKYTTTDTVFSLIDYWDYNKSAWEKGAAKIDMQRKYHKGAKLYDRSTNKIIFEL